MIGMLGTEDMIVKVRDPLLPRSRRIQVSHCFADVLRYAVPEERWILIRQISGGRISELPVHSDFLEFVEQSISLSRI